MPTTIRATIDDLKRGVSLQTGDSHTIVITRPDLELELEWPEELSQSLPEDTSFTLSLTNGPSVTKALRDAQRSPGFVSLRFALWDGAHPVDLVATCGERVVTLWSGRSISTDGGGVVASIGDLLLDRVDDQIGDDAETVVATVELDPVSDPDAFDRLV